MEELVGVSTCVLGDMASRPNFGLNELWLHGLQEVHLHHRRRLLRFGDKVEEFKFLRSLKSSGGQILGLQVNSSKKKKLNEKIPYFSTVIMSFESSRYASILQASVVVI